MGLNYNMLGYSLFIFIIIYIIKVVGRICYQNGNIFVASLIPNNLERCKQINKTLLVGYYLVNIGYGATTLAEWELIDKLSQLIEVMAYRIAIIICILSVLHYLNIFILTTSIQKLIKTT